MNLASCVSCRRPVLELDGQFEKLDSYYIEPGGPPVDSAGWWHASCLAESDAAAAWSQARLRNLRDVRGYQPVAELARWTVLRHPRSGERLALGHAGELLSLSFGRGRGRPVDGGAVYPVVATMFNLQLDDDHATIAAIQRGLDADGIYPLPAVVAALGIADRIVPAIALAGGLFRLHPELRPYWTARAVAARAEYGVFVPAELEPHVGALTR